MDGTAGPHERRSLDEGLDTLDRIESSHLTYPHLVRAAVEFASHGGNVQPGTKLIQIHGHRQHDKSGIPTEAGWKLRLRDRAAHDDHLIGQPID